MSEGNKKSDKLKVVNSSLPHWKPAIKTAFLTAAVFTTISFATKMETQANQSDLATVYHVYVNNDYLGVATDKKVVETYIDKKMEEMKETYGEYQYVVEDDITYIPEQVFRTSNINDQLQQYVSDELAIGVEAFYLEIGGKPVAYVENKEDAEEVIKQLKLKYVSAKELKQLEKQKNSEEELPALKEGESRVLDVTLSKEIAIEKGESAPDNVLSVKDAVKLLQKGTLEEELYEVKEGDVLGKIAAAHNLKTKDLLALNSGITEDTLLQIGQKLNVTVYKPHVQVVVSKEKFVEEKIRHKKEVVADSSMYKGTSKVKQKGKDGLREVTYAITEKNGRIAKRKVIEENVIKEPVKEITLRGTKVIPSRGTGSLTWPASGGYISSGYGYRWGRLHKGIDIARPSNRTIKAADNGTVVSAGWDGGYGNKIVINHNNGFRTVYAHLSSMNVRPGQTVTKGSKIGVMGSTGNSTGVHLHFEVYKNGKLQNPSSYLR